MTRDSDAMLARKATGFEPRSGRSAGPQDIAQTTPRTPPDYGGNDERAD